MWYSINETCFLSWYCFSVICIKKIYSLKRSAYITRMFIISCWVGIMHFHNLAWRKGKWGGISIFSKQRHSSKQKICRTDFRLKLVCSGSSYHDRAIIWWKPIKFWVKLATGWTWKLFKWAIWKYLPYLQIDIKK